ncbi:hypothetical protein [Micromonospora chalcea]|uniref:hypothetical protein n=1 Tax=Micromonospora chalcea TaxID=1874 RepID=UPI003F4A6E88
MMSAAITRVSGWLAVRDIVSLLVPTLAFVVSVLALVARAAGWAETRAWVRQLDGLQVTLLGLAGAATLLVTVLLLQFWLLPLTRMYEGYWGSLRWAQAWARRRQVRRWELLSGETGYRTMYSRFPLDREDIMPTRLGNVFRAAEGYTQDRYGMDAVFFWPRLYPLLPEPLRVELAGLRSVIDLTLVSATFAGVLSVLVVAFAGAADLGLARTLLLATALLLLFRLLYLWSVSAAARYCELVRSAFDISRRTLLAACGVRLPATLEEERQLWQALGQLLYRGGVGEDLEGVLWFKADPL